jgi:hypothetical protein
MPQECLNYAPRNPYFFGRGGEDPHLDVVDGGDLHT